MSLQHNTTKYFNDADTIIIMWDSEYATALRAIATPSHKLHLKQI
jgi:hypothetical protein